MQPCLYFINGISRVSFLINVFYIQQNTIFSEFSSLVSAFYSYFVSFDYSEQHTSHLLPRHRLLNGQVGSNNCIVHGLDVSREWYILQFI